jgi:hypothetical protein
MPFLHQTNYRISDSRASTTDSFLQQKPHSSSISSPTVRESDIEGGPPYHSALHTYTSSESRKIGLEHRFDVNFKQSPMHSCILIRSKVNEVELSKCAGLSLRHGRNSSALTTVSVSLSPRRASKIDVDDRRSQLSVHPAPQQ